MKYIVCICLVATMLVTSCSNNELINEDIPNNNLFLQMEESFLKVGITNIIENYSLTSKEVTVLENELSSTLQKRIAYKIDFNGVSAAYIFKNSETDIFVIQMEGENIVKRFTCWSKITENEIQLLIKENEDVTTFSFDKLSRQLVSNNPVIVPLAINADCDELGSRRPGESYGDCFSRNWSNFCCDFTGCLAQITNPHLVATAIAVTCICPAK